MTATVRAADLAADADGRAIVQVLDTYAREPVAGARPLAAEVQARLPGALRAHPTTVAFLAYDGAEPVGVAVCFLGFSTFHACPLLNVHDLAVVPAWRGRGVGRALLEAVEAEGRRRGCCKLTLEVQEDNQPARRLYARFGFSDYLPGGAPTRFLCKGLGAGASS